MGDKTGNLNEKIQKKLGKEYSSKNLAEAIEALDKKIESQKRICQGFKSCGDGSDGACYRMEVVPLQKLREELVRALG